MAAFCKGSVYPRQVYAMEQALSHAPRLNYSDLHFANSWINVWSTLAAKMTNVARKTMLVAQQMINASLSDLAI